MDKNTLKDAVKTTIEAFEELKSEGYSLNIGTEDLVKVAISMYIQGSRNGNGKLYSDPPKITVNFGKHKGKTIEELVKIDRGYVRWLAEKSENEKVKAESKRLLELNPVSSAQVVTPKPKVVQK